MDQSSHNLRHREGESDIERALMMESGVGGRQNSMDEASEKPEFEKFYDWVTNFIWVIFVFFSFYFPLKNQTRWMRIETFLTLFIKLIAVFRNLVETR